ncbi:pseudouridine synthase [Endogone sp. FLAS-F59071]|nr:pseudouridine synthase [Endogone sp. FLAS-F59071]|eukprot:RUS21723.1 pseudouridine synthase [Endogone sp. FLAS-F59071]
MLQRPLVFFVTPTTFRCRAAWSPLLSCKIMSTSATAPGTDNVNPSAPQKHPLATDSSEPKPTQKKSKHVTNKDRRDHFKKKQSWKSRNQEDAMKAKMAADNEENMEDKEDEDKEEKEARMPKKKVALLIGFCGTGYQGMQINPNANTIEGELFKAFVRAGAVSKDNSDDPHKVSLMRAARTDKGVHAAAQYCKTHQRGATRPDQGVGLVTLTPNVGILYITWHSPFTDVTSTALNQALSA